MEHLRTIGLLDSNGNRSQIGSSECWFTCYPDSGVSFLPCRTTFR